MGEDLVGLEIGGGEDETGPEQAEASVASGASGPQSAAPAFSSPSCGMTSPVGCACVSVTLPSLF